MLPQEFQDVFYQYIEGHLCCMGAQLDNWTIGQFIQCGWIRHHQEELNEIYTMYFLPP